MTSNSSINRFSNYICLYFKSKQVTVSFGAPNFRGKIDLLLVLPLLHSATVITAKRRDKKIMSIAFVLDVILSHQKNTPNQQLVLVQAKILGSQ